MIKFSVHTLEGKRDIIAPSKWSELTLYQIIEIDKTMRDNPDVLKCFSIITGLKLEITKNLNDPKIEQKVFQIVAFLNNPPKWDNLKPPQIIDLKGVIYKVPTKIGNTMLGQKIMLLQALEDPNEILNKTPFALAIMLQPYFDKTRNKGKLVYDDQRVEYYIPIVKGLNGLDCYALAVFFFKKSQILSLIGTNASKTYQPAHPATPKLLRGWLKLSG